MTQIRGMEMPAIFAPSFTLFYDECQRWIKDVDENPESLEEMRLFEESSYFVNMTEDISLRLGLSNITREDLEIMYESCRFEVALQLPNAPWCAAFSPEDFFILEYWQDLKYYWQDGYGYSVNYEQACPLLQDLVMHIRAAEKGAEKRKLGAFYFAHSGTLGKMLARLGLFRSPETNMTAEDFELNHDREWQTTEILPFASNLIVALYHTPEGPQVMTFVNERLVGLQMVDSFLEEFGPIADNCSFKEICKLR
ncbi:unnamed protein product [Darwinula stevensoni]|uniref:Multiple inositol polyphosphate phosphatase 1 n=1 Tax=Darwinula stevensoni TaxID=69355 RepID=A0A7R9AAH5_9CRUS|nr:unnamed protein product [Darwinula stevensoni]CAG0898433.1 unnamed protein product [Darwinula stevensoni]